MTGIRELAEELSDFTYAGDDTEDMMETRTDLIRLDEGDFRTFTNQFWTSRQRRGSSIHEISYRACFKPQLPRFFIERLTERGDTVYDPFSGRGTTPLEAGLMERNVVMNDINPLSGLLTLPRFHPPEPSELKKRLDELELSGGRTRDIDLSMFFHPETEAQISSLRDYLMTRSEEGENDHIDDWVRMVATNRLTGHSSGFFSVYTLPPNQAVSPKRQLIINRKRGQVPGRKDIKKLIMKKSRSLLRNLTDEQKRNLIHAGKNARSTSSDASETGLIEDASIHLTVTSPPFLNIVQYSGDNWLRCWFNGLDAKRIEKHLTVPSSVTQWQLKMGKVFEELHRITTDGGWVAFEVGEIRNGKLRLEEKVIPLGISAGFRCAGVLINSHTFTKTSNIWGVSNNLIGTNSNRVVLFKK